MRLENWDLVDLLLIYGGRLSDIYEFGATALEVAIQSHDVANVTRLLEAMPNSYDAGCSL